MAHILYISNDENASHSSIFPLNAKTFKIHNHVILVELMMKEDMPMTSLFIIGITMILNNKKSQNPLLSVPRSWTQDKHFQNKNVIWNWDENKDGP